MGLYPHEYKNNSTEGKDKGKGKGKDKEKEKEPRHGFYEPLDFAALVWAMARDVGVPSLPDADENGAET